MLYEPIAEIGDVVDYNNRVCIVAMVHHDNVYFEPQYSLCERGSSTNKYRVAESFISSPMNKDM